MRKFKGRVIWEGVEELVNGFVDYEVCVRMISAKGNKIPDWKLFRIKMCVYSRSSKPRDHRVRSLVQSYNQ